MSLTKVEGTENPADLVTKHVTGQLARKYLEGIGVTTSNGRAKATPILAKIANPDGTNEERAREKADRWLQEECRSTRVHHMARTRLFTPCKTNGSPPAEGLESVKITEGKFIDEDEVFKRTDDWRDHAVAHLDLGRAWIGSTRFEKRAKDERIG